jgi:hypothetical protein
LNAPKERGGPRNARERAKASIWARRAARKPSFARRRCRRAGVARSTTGGALYPRLDNKEKGAILIVMQRLHEDDLVGCVMEQGGF